MKRRILSLILFAAMAISMICPVIAANSGTEAASDQRNAIVYIPLDDRPLSLSRVQQLADSLDLTLILPDQDLFATKLDGQGKMRMEPNTEIGLRCLPGSWSRQRNMIPLSFLWTSCFPAGL